MWLFFSNMMQIKLLNDVIGSIAGKTAVDIANLLYGKKDVNEFLIAKKLDLTINQIRNILYKLSDANLVSFSRKKDKKKGWYTYYWTLNLEKGYELVEKTIQKNISNLEAMLKSRKRKNFYTCKNCQIEVSEETALLHNFACQECGEVYELSKSDRMIKNLENEINRYKKEKEIVKIELENLRTKRAKKTERKIKREKAKKKIERAENRKKAKKIRDKLKKKIKPKKLKLKKKSKKRMNKKKIIKKVKKKITK